MSKKSFMKKAGAAIFSAALAFSMFTPALSASAAPTTYVDGTYEGSGEGYISTIKVSVTIKDGKIDSISTVSQNETKAYFNQAVALYPAIIEAQSTDVDSISGATYSSNGIKEAVNAALKLAEGDDTAPNAAIFAGGTGTEADPYQIENAEQLGAFADSLSETVNYADYYVALTSDIDMSASEWSPIGGDQYAFAGTFDGQGYSVSNVHIGTVDQAETVSVTNVGFFGKLAGTAVVENLSLEDEVFNVVSDGKNVLYEGGIAGSSSMSGVSYGGAVVNSCHVDGVMNAKDHNNNIWAGGITGMPVGGAIVNCDTDVTMNTAMTVDQADYQGWNEAGGIVGLNFWTFVGNCYSTGDITVDYYNSAKEEHTGTDNYTAVGGINGLDCGTTFNSYTDCKVTSLHNTSYIGAISGFSESGYANIYASYYNKAAVLVNGTETLATVPAVGVIEDNVTVEATAVDSSSLTDLAKTMTENNKKVPANITSYGVDASILVNMAECEGAVKPAGRRIDHVWDSDYTVDKQPTCTEAGSKSIHCSHCSNTKDAVSIPAAGHKKTAVKGYAATVLKAGKTTGYKCSVCGKVLTAQKTIAKLKPTIKLSAASKTLKVKKTFTLTVSKLAKGDAVKSVVSSKKACAAVKKVKTNSYKITAKKKGTAYITVTLKSGKKAKCKVVVK